MTIRPGAPGSVALLVAALALAGCAGYRPEPLAVSHPAHPDAPGAPPPPPSRTLAHAPSDRHVARPAPEAAGRAPERSSQPARPAPAARVVGEGEVVTTVPAASQIVLDHEAIAGFMEAMTMGYRVDPPSLLTGLREGDRVRFTIDVERRAIVAIEKLP